MADMIMAKINAKKGDLDADMDASTPQDRANALPDMNPKVCVTWYGYTVVRLRQPVSRACANEIVGYL